MLKTRITEQYGLKVPFINAGMAFIATAPLVRAVCSAGGMGMLGGSAMPPDVLQAAIRDIKAVDPASYGVNIIPRSAGTEHIDVCVAEKGAGGGVLLGRSARRLAIASTGGRQSYLVSSWQRRRS